MRASLGRKNLLLALVLVSLYQCCVAQDTCPEQLTNIAVYEGSPASFPNIFQGQTTQWQVVQSYNNFNGLMDITDSNNNVQPPFESTYDANSSTLIIFSSTVAPQGSLPYPTAGLYILSNLDLSCWSGASLVVIKIGPVCSCDDSDPSNKQLICRVDFADNVDHQIYNIMTWIDNSGVTIREDNPVAPQRIDDFNLQSSVSQFPIQSNDGRIFQCQVTFTEASLYPFTFAATNAPNFNESCFASCPLPTTTAEPTTTTPLLTTTEPTTTANPQTTASVALNCSGQNLTHTVVHEGSPASFPRVNNGQSVQWQITPSSVSLNALKNITNYDDILTSAFVGSYAVSQSQLSIFISTVGPQGSMNYSTAGLYILNYRNPTCNTAANLIVIRSGPVCACNASISTSVKLNCSVVYAESPTQPCTPIFIWTNSNGQQMKQEQPVPKTFSTYLKTSQSQLSINSSDTSVYICLLTFSAPARSPLAYVASAPPSFNASCPASCP